MPGAAPVTGLLLAAGAGRRMGLPKALITTPGGRPWLDVAVRALLGCTDEVVVVLGCRADAAAALLPQDARIRPVVAPDWELGMGASLRTGLATLLEGGGHQAALVHLVDLPDVPAAVAARVLEAAGGDLFDGLARATYDGRPGHPVLLGRRHWAPLAASASGDRGARDYLAARAVALVECGDLATGRDRDTSTDLPG